MKKSCLFCSKNKEPDYKDVAVLTQFVSDRGKILDRTKSGLCQKHQKRLSRAVKQARQLALISFIAKA